MINIEGKIKIYLYAGSTDMRKGMHGLAMLAEEKLSEKYDKEGLFVFRGKKGDRLKILWWDGQGFCLYYKCMDKGIFAWLKTNEAGIVGITRAQLSMLIEGIDWCIPIWSNKPTYS
jgi:transposase